MGTNVSFKSWSSHNIRFYVNGNLKVFWVVIKYIKCQALIYLWSKRLFSRKWFLPHIISSVIQHRDKSNAKCISIWLVVAFILDKKYRFHFSFFSNFYNIIGERKMLYCLYQYKLTLGRYVIQLACHLTNRFPVRNTLQYIWYHKSLIRRLLHVPGSLMFDDI